MDTKQATILQIIPRLDTGGAELSAIEIAEALVGAGAQALVATEGGRLANRITQAGGALIAFPAGTKNPLRIVANGRRLRGLIEARGIDLIHARSRAPAWSALMASRRAGIPFVTTYHGAYAESGALKRLYNSVMVRSDIVIANSGYTARLIQERYGTPDARIRVIHRGVDLEALDPARVGGDRVRSLRAAWGVPGDAPVILQAARLTRWKGQTVLIEAAGHLRRTGRLGAARIVLAGDAQGRDDYAQELLALAQSQGVGDVVHCVGHVDDMAAAFLASTLSVVGSIEPEAFGRAATEAQAMGCPVIATNIGAPPETVLDFGALGPDKATGWLVAPRDGKALAEAIASALALVGPARVAMGQRARLHVGAHFTLEVMRRATLEVYDSLLATNMATRR